VPRHEAQRVVVGELGESREDPVEQLDCEVILLGADDVE
jgi:hypothetical protein